MVCKSNGATKTSYRLRISLVELSSGGLFSARSANCTIRSSASRNNILVLAYVNHVRVKWESNIERRLVATATTPPPGEPTKMVKPEGRECD